MDLEFKSIPCLSDKQKDNFFSKFSVENKTGCWLWTAALTNGGYGRFGINKIVYSAHRVSYSLYFSAYKKSLCVLHRCDNRRCINPNHLFLGSKKDNARDMYSKKRENRNRPARPDRSKLTIEQVKFIRNNHKLRDSNFSSAALARKFGVSSGLIWIIVNKPYKIWRNI